jgi:hypothetical protein
VLNEHFDGDGAVVYRHACALGCEGIVSKRLGSAYRSGRADCWVKVKNHVTCGKARGRGGLGMNTDNAIRVLCLRCRHEAAGARVVVHFGRNADEVRSVVEQIRVACWPWTSRGKIRSCQGMRYSSKNTLKDNRNDQV